MNGELPKRVELNPLPRVLVYDHCPFCVRVRHVLGLKNVKYELTWLLNDDVATPTSLVGKKIVPIFQAGGASDDAMTESLDICAAVDGDERYGPSGRFAAASDRKDISEWLDELADPIRRLTRVRFSRAPLPEFTFADARAAYVRNHPLKEPADYDDNFARSQQYIDAVQKRLDHLAGMIHSPEHCTEGGLSYDDVTLFPRLRSLTIIKDLKLPQRIRDYLEWHSTNAEIPLYDYCAI